jgi:DNA-binding transcriptional LysR family regulator
LIETEIDDLLTNESALKSGRLTLAAGSPALILPLIKRYNALYPRVELNLRLDNYDAIQAALQKNQVDIAILDGPIKHERLLSKQYLQQELVLVVNRKHRLAKFKFVSPDDVISEVLLMRSDSSYTQKITEAWFRRARLQFESTLLFGNHNSILEAVSLDIGIGFAFSQEVGDNNIIKKIPLRGSSERCIESLVCQKSQYRRRVVRAFFDLVS